MTGSRPLRLDRRAMLLALAFAPLALAPLASLPAMARERIEIVDVDVRASPIVASRIATDLPNLIASMIARSSDRGGRAVRIIVELRTIDPYRAATSDRSRGLAVRFRTVDAATGRTIRADRFIERTRERSDERGTIATIVRPRTQATGERDLAAAVARHVLRWGL